MLLLIQKYTKTRPAQRPSTQSMHQSENTKTKSITIINKDEHSCPILLYAWVNENQQLNHGGPSQRHTAKPQPTVKVLRRGRYWVWGQNRRRATKERSTAINNDRADNQARSLPHNIQATANSSITVNKLPELLLKVRPTHNPSKPAH